ESYNIGEEETIGRSRKNTIKIDDPFLSQFHARIFKKGNDYYIEDLGSTNGTKLNGEPLGDEAVQLMDNDKIEFGRIAFLFVMPYANKD
ncbi:MAG: FHA domain-containing protein, partial [Clostridiaceae bacterium]|nr:FHA domain-containing protein [Clostridiaceae bacterium]